MLKTYINTIPLTKFILVVDSLESRDSKLFSYLVKQQLSHRNHTIQYCAFEGCFKKTQDKYGACSDVVLHDFVSHKQEKAEDELEQLANKTLGSDVLIVDSLANAIFQLGLSRTYRIFNTMKNNKAIKQIIAVIHEDILPGDSDAIIKYFSHLSTLRIDIFKALTESPRLKYEYKKIGGRVIADIEAYKFEEEQLLTNKLAKPDAKKLLENAKPKQINPEELTTFKIGLTDEEKLARDRVVLPYLPSANENPAEEEGKIFYQLDEVDDWDEEDPDDDLDI
ncbi:elongator complex protein 5 [Dendroctonus ponderosae]|uniref:Elongator complex protein 5 n=1 Tax=Dendroctonus ponderosae TaxID=77166 RepID=U4UD75_DENPD|nr:elongator complex protein 5 [Dendroctonus ponderosae]ERL90273.1 hypothetical protein D910_07625 [Dendroctonus ponderosae]KAH1018637.1 hypothetical protein HUJ05_006366 [Dendroctonus ponderosae]